MKYILRSGDVSTGPRVRRILMVSSSWEELVPAGGWITKVPDLALLKTTKGYHMLDRQMAKWSLIGFL